MAFKYSSWRSFRYDGIMVSWYDGIMVFWHYGIAWYNGIIILFYPPVESAVAGLAQPVDIYTYIYICLSVCMYVYMYVCYIIYILGHPSSPISYFVTNVVLGPQQGKDLSDTTTKPMV
jgi:hypothetical protein